MTFAEKLKELEGKKILIATPTLTEGEAWFKQKLVYVGEDFIHTTADNTTYIYPFSSILGICPVDERTDSAQ